MVAICRSRDTAYPVNPPFSPDTLYPECIFPSTGTEKNAVYEAVRRSLLIASFDPDNFGTARWNPLQQILCEGDFVLLKPNFVKEDHPRDPDGWRYLVTHGSMIRAVADYVFKAVGETGRLVVADAPQTDSSFAVIAERTGLFLLRDYYRRYGFRFDVIDLRKEEWTSRDGVIVGRNALPGDPEGYVAFDLGDRSEFVDRGGEGRYYGADYDAGEVNRHHSGGRHEYLVAGTAIRCDVFINLPKLKTHKKAGITVNLKNLVGINGDKNWLPHHTVGNPCNGGDQFPEGNWKHEIEHSVASSLRSASLKYPAIGTLLNRKTRRVGMRVFGDTETVIRSGNWYGNDTTWRMCLDLNKIILYGNPDGTFRENRPENRKRFLSFVDGIIAGEGSGPMNPDPKPAGLVLFGTDPGAVDAAATVLMGFDPDSIPVVRRAFHSRGFTISEGNWKDICVKSNVSGWTGSIGDIYLRGDVLDFAPHFGWKGHIENSHRVG